MPNPDPHANQPLLTVGPSPDSAPATLILLHGRGSTADSILSLYPELSLPKLAALAPQAANHTWYPHSFLAPIASNQPYLDSALNRVESIVINLLSRNIPANKIAILGFSQGACLTLEFAARNPRPYGALIAFTGGLIGPPDHPFHYPGSLQNVPIFLGSSDPDPHVPVSRIHQTHALLTQMGATVDLRLYPHMPHTINQEELQAAHDLLAPLLS